MSAQNNGGPAFPTSDWDENGRAYKMHGMTLRDRYAIAAMQAEYQAVSARGGCELYSDIADRAYIMADAMLKAREQ